MWDKPHTLLWGANLLLVFALLLFCSALGVWAARTPWFAIHKVEVKGPLSHVTQQQVEYVVQHELKGTFFTLDVALLRDAFSKLPWVKRVSIQRHWPNTVQVNLTEYQAFARWGENGLLDPQGTHFDAATNEFLPILEGPTGAEQEMVQAYRRFEGILAPLGKTPTHIWLSDRRAFKVELDRELIVELGRDYVEERLARFVTVYQDTLGKLLHHKVKEIDLRYTNGFAVSLPHYQPIEKKV